MGRITLLAITTATIYIMQVSFAFFIASAIGKKITELFDTVLKVFP